MRGALGIWHSLMIVVWICILLIPAWRIVKKAGFNGALSLLILVPFLNIVLLWVFAFRKWPVERDDG